MSAPLLHILFFCSGASGLIYQVIWVREFGTVFGNTIHSAALVVAIFMMGLGVGSYLMGRWADGRYQSQPESLVRVYAWTEALIALLGLGVSLVLPHLGALVAGVSAYTTGPEGWHVLTASSYLARGVVATVLLAPITVLMGGTLTLLIRYLVRTDLGASGWKVALLYGVNTAGAAAGAFLTDFALVPFAGLFAAQMVAVALNGVAAIGAFGLARDRRAVPVRAAAPSSASTALPSGAIVWTSLALGLSGFGAMGMEMLWLRHANLLLGGFRAVFSLLMTVILVGIGAGALLGGWLDRRTARPAQALMVVQALWVATVLLGIAAVDVGPLMVDGDAIAASLVTTGSTHRDLIELWYNLRPILIEVGLPALLAGFSFPLANAVVQRAEHAVGRRAGVLYLANTAGAVCGSLATGYLLLPRLGIQSGAAVLAGVAALPIVALHLASRGRKTFFVAGSIAALSITAWVMLPRDFVLNRAMAPQMAGERVIEVSEGDTELIAVVEREGLGRGLITNGHAMASTAPLDQRYMRALVHIPLLSMENPGRVLVIGFGVGNSTQAASLHPSVRQIDVADLSRHILDHASYFRDANKDVLSNGKVSVYLNDGRQHLQMEPAGTYDLITLEPPPIAHAGVAALYSREFYELAKSRLTPGGYLSQWLPAYQVPSESSLAMVRAFIDVFPQAVLLSGTQAELLLVGTTAPRIEIDPDRIAAALQRAPAVEADLARLDLGTVREIVGTFVGSADTLRRATTGSPAVTDDHPLQEYGVMSRLATGTSGVPAALFNLNDVAEWCPRCFDQNGPTPRVAGLDLYMALLGESYTARVADVTRVASDRRAIMGSAYLGTVVPDSAEVHNILGVASLRAGREDEAAREFEAALRRDPASASASQNLAQLRYADGEALLAAGRYAEAEVQFRAALGFMPGFAEAHNNLGVTLASMGKPLEAAEQFRQAVALKPDFDVAQRNLSAALASVR